MWHFPEILCDIFAGSGQTSKKSLLNEAETEWERRY